MAEIVKIAEFFLISLGCGVGLFTSIANSKMTGAGFQKLINSVCLGGLFLGALLHAVQVSPTDIVAFTYYVGCVCFLLLRQLHQDERTGMMDILSSVTGACLFILILVLANYNFGEFSFLFTSAAYLGVITFAMILGHYYLVVPKLTVKPLKISMVVMWILLLVKVIWSSVETANSWAFYEEGTLLGGGYAFNWMMLLMRYIWGYVIIFVMSVFGWKLIRMRSTQSATGILYAMTIFVFIGEMISTYLYFKYGMLI